MFSVSPVSGAIVSFDRTAIAVAAASSATVLVSLAAVGRSLTELIVTLTVPVSLRLPSLSVYVKLSEPFAFAFGVYDSPVPPPVMATMPC